MKKSTDILVRIILVVSILGAIFFYYYGKFVTAKKVEVKSELILLPPFPEKKVDNKSSLKSTVKLDKSKQTENIENKIYKIYIPDYPIKTKILSIKNFLKKYDNVVVNIKTTEKPSEFKRIFVGPYKNKFKMIKVENKLRKLKIEPLRVKIKGVYYLHCGSFLYKEKADDFKKFLYQNGIKDIVIFKFKKKTKFYSINIDNVTQEQLKDIENFLNKLQIKYNVN